MTVRSLLSLERSRTGFIIELEVLDMLDLVFRAIPEQIERVPPAQRLLFHMVRASAQFELDVIREWSNAGLQAARRAGKELCRPLSISEAQ